MVTNVEDNEQVVVKTLVTLPHILPSVGPIKLRNSTLATPLKLHVHSTSSKGTKEITSEDVDLDEVIEIPNFDLATITLEHMQILKEVLKRTTRQE